MNYYQAKELQDKNGKGTGIWNYTCHNDNQNVTYAIGYCAKWIEPILIENDGVYSEEEAEKYKARKDKYHNDVGHKTPEEACECYKNYLLDTSLKFYKKSLEEADTHKRCCVDGCNSMTASVAQIGNNIYDLCDEHLNREEVEKLFKVGSSFGNY